MPKSAERKFRFCSPKKNTRDLLGNHKTMERSRSFESNREAGPGARHIQRAASPAARPGRVRRVLAAAALVLAGCTAPREVAQVLERPAPAEEVRIAAPSAGTDAEAISVPDVELGRFDGGRMWTFSDPPSDYLRQEYGVQLDSSWFERARLGALRFSNFCSASFVSPRGLVLTNHHCARESITKLSREGEDLFNSGFYADSVQAERKVADLYLDQLVGIQDVTERVRSASRVVRGDNEQVRARAAKASDIEKQLTAAVQARDTTLRVEVVEYYDGGRYAAHTYRRYKDVRLVMAPEKHLGYFGGDADNFTYPRYALDMAFFRVYAQDGAPLETENYFRWSASGSREDDVVFTVGFPGSTSRLGSVAALEYERDYVAPARIEGLEARAEVLVQHLDPEPEAALQNALFSLNNTLKAQTGQLEGLRDENLMLRRLASEQTLRRDILANDSLREAYSGLFQDLQELQLSKRSGFQRSRAFLFFGTTIGSHVLTRALYGYYYDTLKRRGFVPEDEMAEVKKEALGIEDFPVEVEAQLIALRLEEIRDALGETDPTVTRITQGLPTDSVAARIAASTALSDSAGYADLLNNGYLASGDVTVEVINALAPLYFAAQDQDRSFVNREELLNSRMVLARFALYGSAAPPDANSTLRISDGTVRGYAYNGTLAPAFTTYYGLYDHYVSYAELSEAWQLPEPWQTPPAAFDLATPLNLVSTNDIAGGNSGSPLLNSSLEVVGLVFDGNIESLPNTYLYTDSTARTVSVDSRGILEALEHIYGAHRIVQELRSE